MIAGFRNKDPKLSVEHLGSIASLASSMLATPATATLSAPSKLKIQGLACITKDPARFRVSAMDADETQEEQVAGHLAGDVHDSDVTSDADSTSDDDDTSTSSVETVFEWRKRLNVTDATAAFAQEVDAARNGAFGPELLQTLLAAPADRKPNYLDEIPEHSSDFYMNTQDENDNRLCEAALFGDALCCFLLIESGANVNCVCQFGFSPLDHALRTSSFGPKPDVVAKLLAAGADFSTKDLCAAVKSQNVKVVQLLLQAGALVHKFCFRDGKAALQFANHPNVVKVLFRGRVAPYVSIERRQGNEAARALMDQIRRAGGWEEYARQHKRVLAGLVAKCTPLPDEAARVVVAYWCPEGGY